MRKALFIEFDAAIADENNNSSKGRLHSFVLKYIAKISVELNFEVVIFKSETTDANLFNFVIAALDSEGVKMSELDLATVGQYDVKASYAVGAKGAEELSEKTGIEYIMFSDKGQGDAGKWKDIYNRLAGTNRLVKHNRTTKETSIEVEINLDGTGKGEIATGLNFLDHMLDQIARHGGFDLKIQAMGDLHIDEHHTIEDTAITLGEAFLIALGDKRGIERYGFCLPMDDALAQVAVDFGGRNYIVWDADFKREKVGDVPTEMFFHFFKSFSDAAKCNLNIKAE
ncbi:MAG: Histidine biosynthesis bifunctional protein HisB, partial [Bacteroidota bacterium]|nr:Histidine biosynthesis bifunctional protein HisB [Bacteroidota bacterium]